MKLLTRKNIIILIILALVALLCFLNLTRTRTASMYLFMARSTPWNIKWECIKKTESQVNQKFTLPLQFDKTSKNALREFCHYSYFRSCLNNNGYDIHGQPIPQKNISQTNSQFVYSNPQAKVTISSSSPIQILTNNQLNPDYDDRILMSEISIDNQPLNLHVYTKHDDIHDLNSAASLIKHFSTTQGNISDLSQLTNQANIPYLFIQQSDYISGILFVTPDNRIVELFSNKQSNEFFNKLANQITL